MRLRERRPILDKRTGKKGQRTVFMTTILTGNTVWAYWRNTRKNCIKSGILLGLRQNSLAWLDSKLGRKNYCSLQRPWSTPLRDWGDVWSTLRAITNHCVHNTEGLQLIYRVYHNSTSAHNEVYGHRKRMRLAKWLKTVNVEHVYDMDLCSGLGKSWQSSSTTSQVLLLSSKVHDGTAWL